MELRHGLSLGIGIFLACLFTWLFIQGANWHDISQLPISISFTHLTLALFPLGLGYIARVWRWYFLLKKHNKDLKIAACFLPYLSAFALNNILPFRLGDIARITLFNQQLGAGYAAITSSLLIERIIDFISLLLIFSVCTFFLSISIPQHNEVFEYIFVIAISAMICILFFLAFPIAIAQLLLRIDVCLQKWHMEKVSRAVYFVRKTAEGIYLHNNFRSLLALFGISVCIWIAEATIFWLVAQSMGMKQQAASSFFVMSLSTFSTLLPSTPGYIGTFHYLCRLALEWVGVVTDFAIVYALLVHAVIVLPITLVGIFSFVHHFGNRWKSKLQAAWGST